MLVIVCCPLLVTKLMLPALPGKGLALTWWISIHWSHFILGDNKDWKIVWLYAVVDVSNVRINIWKTLNLLRMMDSMICIIHAYHATHTLVMLMGKHITLAKYANTLNPKTILPKQTALDTYYLLIFLAIYKTISSLCWHQIIILSSYLEKRSNWKML